jgi:hypothetical protein
MHSNDKDDHSTRNAGPPSEKHKIGKTSQAQALYFETWPMVFAPTLIIQPLDGVSYTLGLLISRFFAWRSHFFRIRGTKHLEFLAPSLAITSKPKGHLCHKTNP